MKQRTKYRWVRTLYLILIIVFFTWIFVWFNNWFETDLSLLLGFIIGLILFILFEFFAIKHMKDKQMKINSATQIYIGFVALLSSLIVLFLNLVFGILLDTGFILLSIVIIIILLITIKPFDDYLERRLK